MSIKDLLSKANDYDFDTQSGFEGTEAEAMMEAFEAMQEIAELELAFAQEEFNMNLLLSYDQTLENAIPAIESYGISKTLFAMLDADGMISECAEVKPAVESFDDLPTGGENAEQAIEAIKDTLKKVWEAIKSFFKKIGAFIAKIWQKFLDLFKSNEKICLGIIAKLKKVKELDKEKLKDAKVKYPEAVVSSAQWSSGVAALSSLVSITIENGNLTEEAATEKANKILEGAATKLNGISVVKSATATDGTLKVEFNDNLSKTSEKDVLEVAGDIAAAMKLMTDASTLFRDQNKAKGLDAAMAKYINTVVSNSEKHARADESKKPLVKVYKAYQAVAKEAAKVSAALTKQAIRTSTANMKVARAIASASK